MELQLFVEKIKEKLVIIYGKTVKIEHHQVYKNNGILLQGICVLKEGQNIAPTIYLNEFFHEYQEGKKIDDIITKLCQLIDKNQPKKNFNINFFMDYEKLKNHLVYRVINCEKNKELLKEVPYKELQDLAIVCHCLIENDEIGTGSVLIHHHHLKTWKIEEEQLFKDTFINSPILEPGKVYKMSSLVKEILTGTVEKKVEEICEEYPQNKEQLVENTLNQMVEEMEEGQIPMYVLTNSRRYYGAASLVYDNMMEQIAELFQNDYYILPSSVHELILLEKTEDICPEMLNDMIVDVNLNQVEADEWLSDHAYYYSRERKILLAV